MKTVARHSYTGRAAVFFVQQEGVWFPESSY